MPLVFERQVEMRLPRQQVWAVLRDTDRLNRAQGLPPVSYLAVPTGDRERKILAEARVGWLRLRWVEQPFEWVDGRRHFVVRTFPTGPLREFRGGITLADSAQGTVATVRAEIEPRNLIGTIMARIGGPRAMDAFVRTCRALEDQMLAEREVVLAGEEVRETSQVRMRAAHALARHGIDGEAGFHALIEYLATRPDRELMRIRPFVLARQWARPRFEVLELCLRATRAGLLELSWDVICPDCRGAQGAHSLADLKQQGSCETCGLKFDVNFDDSVEVTFRPHPAVRLVERTTFCAFGPGNTPHVLTQVTLPEGGQAEEKIVLRTGRYRVRSPQSQAAVWLDAAPEGSGVAVVYLRPERIETPTPRVLNGEITVVAHNVTPGAARLLIERAEWEQDAATAAIVSSVQSFRDLFATEALSPDVQLGVASLTFVFTDLKGSTSLYADMGDARAYALVRDHFEVLGQRIRACGGGIVKTIGDAVMAVFYEPAAGLKCCLEIQEAVAEFNRNYTHRGVAAGADTGGGLIPPAASPAPLVVKMGIHTGPCLAVRLNDRLDYFGSTVNVAARVQHLSEGGDVVVTEEVLADPAASGVLARYRLSSERFQANLRGCPENFWLARLRAGPSEGLRLKA